MRHLGPGTGDAHRPFQDNLHGMSWDRWDILGLGLYGDAHRPFQDNLHGMSWDILGLGLHGDAHRPFQGQPAWDVLGQMGHLGPGTLW